MGKVIQKLVVLFLVKKKKLKKTSLEDLLPAGGPARLKMMKYNSEE